MTRAWSWIFSLLALATLALMVGLFAWQSIPVWRHEGWSYVTGAKWFFRQKEFGALSMIYGSAAVAFAYCRAPAVSSVARATADAISGTISAGTITGSPRSRIAERICKLATCPFS